MTRKYIALALSLSPMMLHAQAKLPVQPSAPSSSVLESKLVTPAEVADADTPKTAGVRRISTGVNPPYLVHSEPVAAATDHRLVRTAGHSETAVVSMVVDARGVPSDLKIVQSVSPEMDRNILNAVSRYRFRPGTLDNQPTAVPVNLELTIQNTEW